MAYALAHAGGRLTLPDIVFSDADSRNGDIAHRTVGEFEVLSQCGESSHRGQEASRGRVGDDDSSAGVVR